MTYDLQNFDLRDMIDAGRKLRQVDLHHGSMEAAAAASVNFLYNNLRLGKSPDGERNCVLVRCFKTHAFGDLPAHLQQKASLVSTEPLSPEAQCLVLLATRGECPHWNSRLASAFHQAIPLPTVKMVNQTPMIAQLLLQLGVKLENVVSPVPPAEGAHQAFGVFHVETALGSGSVPEQSYFVEPFGIRSVLGFGGLLPAGELFAIILFARVTIPPESAAMFRTLALGVKLTLLPFSGKQIFIEH